MKRPGRSVMQDIGMSMTILVMTIALVATTIIGLIVTIVLMYAVGSTAALISLGVLIVVGTLEFGIGLCVDKRIAAGEQPPDSSDANV